jgi:hypothetical protein
VKSVRENVPSSRLLLSPDGDVRRDTGLDQPTEELACAVGRVGDETLGLEPQPLLGPRDHSLGGSDLVTGSGRRGFHVDQADVYNQVVKELSEGRKRSHWMWFVFPQPEPIIYSRGREISRNNNATSFTALPRRGRQFHPLQNRWVVVLRLVDLDRDRPHPHGLGGERSQLGAPPFKRRGVPTSDGPTKRPAFGVSAIVVFIHPFQSISALI